MKYIISKCLVGINCKYNGLNNLNERIKEIYEKTDSILICPEELGGLPTPRIPSEIKNERVINKELIDVTNNFIIGAMKSLELAKKNNVKIAILKEFSPSCGCNYIYDGTFTGKKIKGSGITAKLFMENGIRIYTEKDDLDDIEM